MFNSEDISQQAIDHGTFVPVELQALEKAVSALTLYCPECGYQGDIQVRSEIVDDSDPDEIVIRLHWTLPTPLLD